MFSFNNLEWYISCFSNQNFWEYYNYYNVYDQNTISKDEKWNEIELKNCYINIFLPYNKNTNKHFYISIKLQSTKNNISKNLEKTIIFLEKYLQTYTKKDWKIPNILKNENKLPFKDIDNQTKEYKNFLNILLRYNMIKKSNNFDWNKPITYWEFFYTYFSNIYKIDLSNKSCKTWDYNCLFEKKINNKKINTILKEDLWIKNYWDFVLQESILNIDFLINIYINFSKKDIKNIDELYNNINEEKYKYIKDKINNFNNSIYKNKKILLQDFYSEYNTSFFTQKIPYFYPDKKQIIYKKTSSILDFSYKHIIFYEIDKLNKKYNCYDKKDFLSYKNCIKKLNLEIDKLKNKYIDSLPESLDLPNYQVLTKANMLEYIFTKVDFSLFDKELEIKKQ